MNSRIHEFIVIWIAQEKEDMNLLILFNIIDIMMAIVWFEIGLSF